MHTTIISQVWHPSAADRLELLQWLTEANRTWREGRVPASPLEAGSMPWRHELNRPWHEGLLTSWVNGLVPPPGHPLRRLTLTELVKLDLFRCWQAGVAGTLESYLHRYPELGTAETVAAELILAEYTARRQFACMVSPEELARRFPGRLDEVRRLDGAAALALQPGPAPADEHNPPEPGMVTRTNPAGGEGPAGDRPLGPGDWFGRYQIVQRLGVGGMGDVYLAHDSHLFRRVALKVPRLHSVQAAELRDRFRREAVAAARLECQAGICPVYDFGEVQGTPYLTMAFIPGPPLTRFINPDQPLSVTRAVAIVHRIARTMARVHRHQIIHRDLKPANIVLDDEEQPVLIDFGLARLVDDPLAQDGRVWTRYGQMIGTAAYMAPEQLRGEWDRVGPASDVYSLGVILYELLTGRRPFQGPVSAVYAQVLLSEPDPPSGYRHDLSPDLEAVCLKAMAPEVADRYAGMDDLAAALEPWLSGDQSLSRRSLRGSCG